MFRTCARSGYSAGPQFPATSPHVTAVGGTSLRRSNTCVPIGDPNCRYFTESVWSGAGSGCSKVYLKRMWQVDTACSMRMEADVSAVGDPSTGVAVYGPVVSSRSGWMVFGGTSVGAPLIAAIYGLNGGLVDYGHDPYSPTASAGDPPGPYTTNPDLNVITSGNNGACSGSYFCTASPSWNYNGPTGLGTPDGAGAFGK